MALGFGFNKAKVLSAAEKYVQQGKFNNAIAEYEKVIRHDPGDMTTLNTAGDLYARLGRMEQAIQCFRRVGEAYAADGFTVKAIAMYKKVTKLSPNSMDCIRKLAELYSQQGLNNDARVQYLQLADHFLRVNDHEQASRIFERLLDLDPENSAMQSRLADLYLKLGRNVEARAIYFRAAETSARAGAREATEQALERTLKIDPDFGPALAMRGRTLSENGRHQEAVQCLERLRDLDSQPDALNTMLRSFLALKKTSEALIVAGKLLSVHNDVSGITACTDAMIRAGDCEGALRLCHEHADCLLAKNASALVRALHNTIDELKDNARGLETLRQLYEKAGDRTHLNEINELLAHALVQEGQFARARDLYKELADAEPDNPVHLQNYNQVRARMGEDTSVPPVPVEKGDKAFMVDELESATLAVEMNYPREVVDAVKSAITDSELLDSYNLTKKALSLLEAVLPEAPLDPMLNQRLASLYAREERFSEAARCCDVLRAVYGKAGHSEQAERYAEMASRYRNRISEVAPEFSAEKILGAHERQFPSPGDTTESLAPVEEIDISHEWESLLVDAPAKSRAAEASSKVELEDVAATLEARPAQAAATSGRAVQPPVDVAAADKVEAEGESQFISSEAALANHLSAVGDLIEEIRFYISQEMVEEAEAAIERCVALAPELTDLDDLRRELATIKAPANRQDKLETQPYASESATSDLRTRPSTPPAIARPQVGSEMLPAAAVARLASDPGVSADPLDELVFDLEESLPAEFGREKPSAPKTVAEPEPVPAPKMAIPAAPTAIPKAAPSALTTLLDPAVVAGHGNGAKNQGSSLLAELFEDFKEEVERDSHAEHDDPETHYNLGIAFREMGLLDEAIGEFQKVCHSIDGGNSFSRILETYTWLAQCLVDKGAPQAAIKWYERALRIPGVNAEAAVAVHYDMACALQAAGNNSGALNHFMEVYGTNIDYRDIAERIKFLQRS